jgi:hypothetical protein
MSSTTTQNFMDLVKEEQVQRQQSNNYKMVVNSLRCIHKSLNVSHQGSYNNITYGDKEEDEDYFETFNPLPMADLFWQEWTLPPFICEKCFKTFDEGDKVCKCRVEFLPIFIKSRC